MRPPRIRSVAIVSAVLLAGFVGATSVAAAPPPMQLCGTCGSSIVDADSSDPQTLEIEIDEDGDSRWVERVPVNDTLADRYAANQSRLEAEVEDAFWGYNRVDDFSALDPGVELEDGAVVVTYEVENVARPGVGDAWLVDYFSLGESNDRYGVEADRIDLRAPEGFVVTNRPAFSSVDGNTATWERSDVEAAVRFGRQTHVTYGPDGGILGWAAGQASIARAVGPMVARHAALGGGPAAVFLGLAAVAVGRASLPRAGRLTGGDADALGRRIAAVGLVGGIGLYVLGAVAAGDLRDPNAVVAGALGVGYAALAALCTAGDDALEIRGLVVRSIVAAALAVALAWILGGLVAAAYAVLVAVPTALFAPIGRAAERAPRGTATVALVAVLALVPVVVTAAVAPVGFLGFGPLGYGVFTVLTWPFVVAIFGAPLAFLGRRLARESEPTA